MNIFEGPKGIELELKPAQSLAICFEFSALWASDQDEALLARLCSAALGVCLDHMARYPRYNPLRDKPLEYGFKMMDRLLGDGWTPSLIYEGGSRALLLMSQKLPSSEEVEDTVNFTSPKEDSSTT